MTTGKENFEFTKKNPSIEDIFNQILADEEFKRDVNYHPSQISVNPETGRIVCKDLIGEEDFGLNKWSLSQWTSKMNGLTPKYWTECPNWLKAQNGNHWLQEMAKELEKKKFDKDGNPVDLKRSGDFLMRVREGGVDSEGNELGSVIRGIMSQQYTKFDDIKLVEMLMTILEEKGEQFQNLRIAKYHRDDLGFHVRLLFNEPVNLNTTYSETARKAVKGEDDIHYRGIMIENSEVGRKSIRIRPFVWRLVCDNGLVAYNFDSDVEAFKQRHTNITEVEIREKVAVAMVTALNATEEVLKKLLKAKGSKPIEAKKAEKIIEQFSKECKYDKKFTQMVKDTYAGVYSNMQTPFGIVQAFTETVQKTATEHIDKEGKTVITEFSKYNNIDDRVRVETDAHKLLERLTA